MTAITNDKYMQFVIDHYTEIQALNELVQYTEERLPHIIRDEIIEAILELEDSYFHEQGLKVDHDKSHWEVWWYDPTIYSWATGTGPYFGFWYRYLNWDHLETTDREEAADFYLFIDTTGVKKTQNIYVDQWIGLLQTNETKLRKTDLLLGYRAEGFDHTDPYLITYPLYKELKIEAIKDRENFRYQIQEAVKTFTSAILPILRENKVVG
jgi:hypothetical protein